MSARATVRRTRSNGDSRASPPPMKGTMSRQCRLPEWASDLILLPTGIQSWA